MAYYQYTAITTTRTHAKQINLAKDITLLPLLPSPPLSLITNSYSNTDNDDNNNGNNNSNHNENIDAS